MAGLEFSFQETIDEVQALMELARKFLDQSHLHTMGDLIVDLQGYRDNRSDMVFNWGIPESRPLKTIVSDGAYRSGGKGGHKVFAEVTSVWEILRIRPKNQNSRAERFSVCGKASTRVRLIERDMPENHQLAMWRMEIGTGDSPGCHFHVQVLGEELSGPFPRSLDIPRLPSIIATPAAVIEYVLGELFQDKWRAVVSAQSPSLNRWAPIQKRRLVSLLSWHTAVVQGSSGSPLSALKAAKPDAGMFRDR